MASIKTMVISEEFKRAMNQRAGLASPQKKELWAALELHHPPNYITYIFDSRVEGLSEENLLCALQWILDPIRLHLPYSAETLY